MEERKQSKSVWWVVALAVVGLGAAAYFVLTELLGNPQAASAHLEAGRHHLDQGNVSAAIAEFEEAVHSAPRSKEAYFQLGLAYARAGRFAEAARAFETALTLGADASTYSNLGVVYYQMGRYQEAIEQYQQALALAPNDAEVHSNLGAAYAQLKRYDDARTEYEKAISIKSDLAEAYFGLGTIYALQGKTQEAIAAFQRFLALDTGRDPRARTEAERQLQMLGAEQK